MAASADSASPPLDPVAAVWQSPELLGHVASFLDPNPVAWIFTNVNKAAAVAFDSDGQLLPRIAPLESLRGMAVAVGLSPIPLSVLVAAASVGRLVECRCLVDDLGCTGLHRLACLCLLSAASVGAVAAEAQAWLEPGTHDGWSEADVAAAASGDIGAVLSVARPRLPTDRIDYESKLWMDELSRLAHTKLIERRPVVGSYAASPEFYRGPRAAQAVARLAELPTADLKPIILQVAAGCGHTEAVRHLLERGVRPAEAPAANPAEVQAARGGHLGVLQALHAAGCVRDAAGCFKEGLGAGSLPLALWLVETFGASTLDPAWSDLPTEKQQQVVSDMFVLAARSGNAELMDALPRLLVPRVGEEAVVVARDPGDPGLLWCAAAGSGCEAAVEWLVPRYPPERAGPAAVAAAGRNSDVSMLLRLRKLGCPWNGLSTPDALAKAAGRVPASAAVALPWLQQPGYPSSWGAAAAAAQAELDARKEAEARVRAVRKEGMEGIMPRQTVLTEEQLSMAMAVLESRGMGWMGLPGVP
ncbi:hypothetical protein HYH03_009835 [Edaphochlamys debaryana]|uniref:Uncharacterized protein n=1 Tax=Edaphochlamys debaryana TaxID=47281 RepID=A0A835XX76_9CHLO|nr:hypothetical protein HYH03_009835 [Edaphochlamys debaryana]|eukprot:KAG2491883.1 hypothetical protein HYH03_009835 [Edaphochlamys debaryana]